MKAHLFVAAAISAVLSASPALAARICNNITIKSPAAGAELPFGVPPTFRWTAEPEGAVSRAVVIAGDQGIALAADSRYRLHTKKVLPIGSYFWSLTFTDKDGKVICTTPAVAFAVTEPKPGVVVVDLHEAANRNFAPAPPPVVVMTSAGPAQLFIRNGRYVIVLQNSPYTGPYTQLVASDNFDGSAFVLPNGITGLEIYGNNNPNDVKGTAGPDIIYVYGGDDVVNPGAGQDEVHYGTASNFDTNKSADGEHDTLYFETGLALNGINGAATDPGDSLIIGP